MAVPLNPDTSTDRALSRMERERKEEADGMAAAWVFLWTLFVFKLATVGIIIVVASGSGESIGMALATTWYWLVIPGLALAGPLLVRWRMMKLRRRREQLRRSEWEVEPTVTAIQVIPEPRSHATD